jgi:phytoene synthase
MSEWDFPNAATPAGSGPYYVVRFSPPAQQARLARLFAWRAELAHIVDQANDPGVARLKLDWWRDELQRARAGTARHPLAMALTPLLRDLPPSDAWWEMLDAAEQDLQCRVPDDLQAFTAQCDRLGGALGALLAGALGGAPDDLPAARQLGLYHEAVTRLRDLHLLVQRRHCPLPRQLLEACGLSPEDLHRAAAAPLHQALELTLGPLADQAAAAARVARRIPALGPARRLAAQADALHRALRRRGYPVLAARIELTPLRLLWRAWRA